MTPAPPDFEPRRFRGNVPYYAKFRLGYPDALIARVTANVGMEPGDRVMDLGCGPGLLAIPFAVAGMAVTAIDPEPEMLAELNAAAQQARVSIDARLGSSFDMPPGIGPFKLVTMGRSFHWMDRTATLGLLDRLVAADGAIALFDDRHPRTVENGWRQVLREVEDAYGRDRSQHVLAATSAGYRTHESVLFDSCFCDLERIAVFTRRELTADDIVGLAFSLSSSSPEKLGERARDFERDLRAALARTSPDNRFAEIAELSALIAKRAATVHRGSG